MKIQAEATLIPKERGGKAVGLVRVMFDEKFIVEGFKVIKGEKGLFISYPSSQYPDKTTGELKYFDMFNTLDSSFKQRLERAIFSAFKLARGKEE